MATEFLVDVDSLESAPVDHPEIETGEVKARAVSGASAMVMRGFAVRAIGLLGNIVLARLLTPDDFGIAALGLTILTFANAVAEGGIAAGFVRGKTGPSRTDLHAAVAVQFYVSTLILVVCGTVATVLGSREAIIAVVMVAGMPLLAFRTPAFIHFERTLDFSPLIKVEIAETLAYFAFAIITIALGAGVWGLAIGQGVRILVGTGLMVEANPGGLTAPRWNGPSIRSMLGFGLQFQGIALAALCVTQGMNIAVASVAGLAGLGVWSLVFRLLQIPLMVFSSLRRVSYPAVARLMAAEADDLPAVLRRVAKLSAVMGGLMVVGVLGASEPGVVLAFGERWRSAEHLLPLCAAVVFINGPVSVAAFSYAMASGRLTTGLVSTAVQAIAGPAIIIAAFPLLGIESIAAATCTLAVFEAAMLGSVMWRGLRVNMAPMMVFYGAMVAAGGLAGRFVALSLPQNWLAVVAGLVVSELVFVALLTALQPRVAKDVWQLSRRAVKRS